jgi:hypothetical protein
MAIDVLKKQLLQSPGYAIAIEIENAYLSDHIRNKLSSLGHESDGSFTPSHMRLSESAAASLISSCLNDADRKKVEKALAKVGGNDKSVTGHMTKLIARAASTVAGKVGEAVVNIRTDLLASLLKANEDKIAEITESIIDFTRGMPTTQEMPNEHG